MPRNQSRTYRYREAEATLAESMGVRAADMPAFKAKLRHLRNIGTPTLPKVGTGTAVEYSRLDIIEVRAALELAWLGQSPKHAGTVALFLRNQIAKAEPNGESMLVVDRVGGAALRKLSHIEPMLGLLVSCAILNPKNLVASIDVLLSRFGP